MDTEPIAKLVDLHSTVCRLKVKDNESNAHVDPEPDLGEMKFTGQSIGDNENNSVPVDVRPFGCEMKSLRTHARASYRQPMIQRRYYIERNQSNAQCRTFVCAGTAAERSLNLCSQAAICLRCNFF